MNELRLDRMLEPLSALDIMFGQCRSDAWLAFGSRRVGADGTDHPRFLYPMKVSALHEWFPFIVQHQLETSQSQYVAQNTVGEKALRRSPEAYEDAYRARRPMYFATHDRETYELAALVVDLDVGRTEKDLSDWEALAVVGNRCSLGELPYPALAVLSGRGVHLWWLLTSEDGHPPLATIDNKPRWRLILEKLLSRTSDLEACHGSKRLLNWFKRPSVDKGKEGICVSIGLGHPDAKPRYRLSELVELLDLHHAEAELRSPAETAPALIEPWSTPSPARPRRLSRNCAAPQRLRVEEIELLAAHREGIREGIREKTLWHYYHSRRMFLLKAREDADEPRGSLVQKARDDTRKFNVAYCRPPMAASEVNVVFTPLSRGKYNVTGPTVARDLQVTDEEADALGLRALATDARRSKLKEETASKAEELQARRDRTDAFLLEGLRVEEVMRQTGERRQYVNDRKKVLLRDGKLAPDPAPQIDLVTS